MMDEDGYFSASYTSRSNTSFELNENIPSNKLQDASSGNISYDCLENVQDNDLLYPGINFLHGKGILIERIHEAQKAIEILSNELHLKENDNKLLKQQNENLLQKYKNLENNIGAIKKENDIKEALLDKVNNMACEISELLEAQNDLIKKHREQESQLALWKEHCEESKQKCVNLNKLNSSLELSNQEKNIELDKYRQKELDLTKKMQIYDVERTALIDELNHFKNLLNSEELKNAALEEKNKNLKMESQENENIMKKNKNLTEDICLIEEDLRSCRNSLRNLEKEKLCELEKKQALSEELERLKTKSDNEKHNAKQLNIELIETKAKLDSSLSDCAILSKSKELLDAQCRCFSEENMKYIHERKSLSKKLKILETENSKRETNDMNLKKSLIESEKREQDLINQIDELRKFSEKQRANFQQMNEKHKKDIEKLNIGYKKQFQNWKINNMSQIEELQGVHESKIQEISKTHKAEIEKINENFKSQLDFTAVSGETEIDQLKSQIETVECENRDLRENILKAEEQYELVLGEKVLLIETQQLEIDKLIDNNNNWKNEHSALVQKEMASEFFCNQLKVQMEKINHQLLIVESENKDLKVKMNEQEHSMKDKQESFLQEQDELILKNKNQCLLFEKQEISLKELQTTIATMNKEISNLNQTIIDLKQTNEDLNKRIKVSEMESLDIKTKFKIDIEKMKNEHAGYVDSKEQKIQNLVLEIENFKSMLREKGTTVDSIALTNERLKEEIVRKESEMTQLKKELDNEKSHLNSLKIETLSQIECKLEVSENTKLQLEEQLADSKKEKNHLKVLLVKTQRECKSKMQNYEKDILDLTNDQALLKKEKHELLHKIEKFKQEYRKKILLIQNVENSLSAKQKQLDISKEEIGKLMHANTVLETSNMILSQDVESLKGEHLNSINNLEKLKLSFEQLLAKELAKQKSEFLFKENELLKKLASKNV